MNSVQMAGLDDGMFGDRCGIFRVSGHSKRAINNLLQLTNHGISPQAKTQLGFSSSHIYITKKTLVFEKSAILWRYHLEAVYFIHERSVNLLDFLHAAHA